MRQRKIFIVGGGGMVGATAAYAIAIRAITSEIVLIDVAEDLVRGQAADINHAAAFTQGTRVRVGDYNEIQEDDIVVITSGASLKPGQTRLELVHVNAAIIKDVTDKIMAQGKPVFIVMVANPVDVLTQVALKTSGLPKERVLGTGTTVDTIRLRSLLAERLKVSPEHVHAYVLGEHGDASFPALSNATVSGIPLPVYPGYTPDMLEAIDNEIRTTAYKIVEVKKSTWGIGNAIAQVVAALLQSTPSVLPVCSLVTGEYGLQQDVVVGLPSLVSSNGVAILDGYPLDTSEQKQLQHAASVIREVMASVK